MRQILIFKADSIKGLQQEANRWLYKNSEEWELGDMRVGVGEVADKPVFVLVMQVEVSDALKVKR